MQNTTNTMNTMSVKEMAETIRRHGPYFVWIGDLGYDTRPHVGADPLPVQFSREFAENFREPEEVPEWHLEEALESLEVGEAVCLPEYLGSNYQGEETFVKKGEGFIPLGYRRAA